MNLIIFTLGEHLLFKHLSIYYAFLRDQKVHSVQIIEVITAYN